jgi:acyl-CoA dehydrogenase
VDFTIDPNAESIQQNLRAQLDPFDDEYWRRTYEDRRFPVEFWNALAKNGWLSISVATEWGGQGKSLTSLVSAIETVAKIGGAGAAYPYVSHLNAVHAITQLGTRAQKSEYLRKLSKGEFRVALALTEEESGSDALGIETSAHLEGEQFVVNGNKYLINEADRVDLLILVTRTTPAERAPKRSFGLTIFLVNAKDQAIRIRKLEKLGLDHLTTCTLEIRQLRVAREAVLGEVDEGWHKLVETLNVDRVTNAAMCVGAGRLALSNAIEYARNRIVFGSPIGANQGIQFPLAEVKSELDVSELMTHKAAWLIDHGKRADIEANAAILRASDAAFHAADVCLQVHGGHGYLKNAHVERYWRDLRLFKLGPLSHELTLAYIAEKGLGLPKSYGAKKSS